MQHGRGPGLCLQPVAEYSGWSPVRYAEIRSSTSELPLRTGFGQREDLLDLLSSVRRPDDATVRIVRDDAGILQLRDVYVVQRGRDVLTPVFGSFHSVLVHLWWDLAPRRPRPPAGEVRGEVRNRDLLAVLLQAPENLLTVPIGQHLEDLSYRLVVRTFMLRALDHWIVPNHPRYYVAHREYGSGEFQPRDRG